MRSTGSRRKPERRFRKSRSNWLLQRPTVSSGHHRGARREATSRQPRAIGWNLTKEQVAKLDEASSVTLAYLRYWHQARLHGAETPRRCNWVCDAVSHSASYHSSGESRGVRQSRANWHQGFTNLPGVHDLRLASMAGAGYSTTHRAARSSNRRGKPASTSSTPPICTQTARAKK